MIASSSSPDPVVSHDDVASRLLEFLHAAELAHDEPELYDALHRALAAVIPYDRFSIGWINRDTRRITLVFERGATIGLPIPYESLPTDARSLPHAMAQEGRTVVHTVPATRDAYRGDPLWRRFGIRQVLVVPVPRGREIVAVLKLYRTTHEAFSEAETRTTEAFARVLGLALADRARQERDADTAMARVVTDTLDRISHASSPGELLSHLQRGIVAITDATVFLVRMEDGTVRFVEGHNPHPGLLLGQPLHEAGARAARRIAEVPPEALALDGPTTLFTDPRAASDAGVPVRGIDVCHDFLNTHATALTVLRDRDPHYGILAAWHEDVLPETAARHAAWIDQLARPAAPDLTRLVEMERLEQRVAELDIIRRLIDTIARTPKPRDAFEVICRTAQMVTDVDFVAIGESVNNYLTWHAAVGALDPSFVGKRHPVPPRILHDFLQHRYEILLPDVRKEPDMTPEIMPVHTAERLRSTVILPVHVNARLRGAMMVSQRHLHEYSRAELSLLHQIAGTIATAIAAGDARMPDDADA